MNKPEGWRCHGNDVVLPGGGRVAVLVPCFNEEAAVAKVVADFRAALTAGGNPCLRQQFHDRTAEIARAAGALVRRETHQGKGNVVRRMFPTWTRTSTCWSTATQPMTRPAPAP